jgi:hypothetical protein
MPPTCNVYLQTHHANTRKRKYHKNKTKQNKTYTHTHTFEQPIFLLKSPAELHNSDERATLLHLLKEDMRIVEENLSGSSEGRGVPEHEMEHSTEEEKQKETIPISASGELRKRRHAEHERSAGDMDQSNDSHNTASSTIDTGSVRPARTRSAAAAGRTRRSVSSMTGAQLQQPLVALSATAATARKRSKSRVSS